MEDKTVKTIDFLRARLLAERSVSRTARQRAYELSKRVTELEKQLKYVSLQRKKAEKATVDVLLILENHGRNNLSEQFDSSSEQEETSSQHPETSTLTKPQESEFSSSEVESSRSLSWKSSKNSSSRFLEKKYTDASRRRRNNSFTSTGSSPRRVGKSCRQIRHRSAGDVSQNDDVTNGQTSSEKNDGSEKDMEKALENQAKFIARFEDEEKAQREWEDKFRENNTDSCDPGTHSDVTEERDEIKVPVPSCCNDKTTPGSPELNEETNIETEPILDMKNNDVVHMENKVSENDNQGHVSSSEESNLLYKGEQSSSKSCDNEATEKPGQLGSVLEALQQAKLSLKSLDKFPLLQNGPSYKPMEKFAVPVSPVGLFRLPTDYEYEQTTPRVNNSLTYDSRLSLTSQQYTGPSGGQLGHFVSTEPLSSSSASIDDRFRMVPTFPYQETRFEPAPSALDPRYSVGPPARDPRLNVGDPRLGVGPPVRDPRLDLRFGRDPRLDVGLGQGQAARDSRFEMGSNFTGDRYMRSVDNPLQARSLYGDHMTPNTYK